MPRKFNYTVKDRAGREITGSLEAENADVLTGKLRQMGYFVVSVDEVRVSMAKKELHIFGAKVMGAGGGGFVLFVCKSPEAASRLRENLDADPPNGRARFFDFSISSEGLVVTVC